MNKPVFLIIAILLLAACKSGEKTVYLQDINTPYSAPIPESANVTIKKGDWLTINVNSRDHLITELLNVEKSVNGKANYSGYLVDDDGYIDFPEYGLIRAHGLTLVEMSAAVKKALMEKGLAKNPVVTTQFANYNFSVMGEVAHPGNFTSTTGKVSIFEAISKAGDLTIFGKRDNVMIIREENGQRTIGRVDLRSKTIFSSPFYYLHQNDVVYVEPNNAKAAQRDINPNRTISTYTSLASLAASLAVLIFKK
ncbi:MAG: polysaccharide biosynthesis/export family protein [Bacteroidaceae bacterium]|nr:polysaccharide biosynthesis/export family protein [Bacteroidaceae bacterium]